MNEIIDMMESYVRCEERKRKQKISDDFVMTKAYATNLANIIAGKSELCNPWDFYPQLFAEDKDICKEQVQKAEWADYAHRRRQWVQEFNRRREQGM